MVISLGNNILPLLISLILSFDIATLKEYLPIYSITFGSADEYELQDIAELTNGKVFDGRSDLVSAFKEVRGYN